VQRILTKYSQLPVIPDKILVAKRLFQCLNSSLPSGVHLTTLQTYELIFSRIGSARLARDLAFYTEGIFTLYRHASYQVGRNAWGWQTEAGWQGGPWTPNGQAPLEAQRATPFSFARRTLLKKYRSHTLWHRPPSPLTRNYHSARVDEL